MSKIFGHIQKHDQYDFISKHKPKKKTGCHQENNSVWFSLAHGVASHTNKLHIWLEANYFTIL